MEPKKKNKFNAVDYMRRVRNELSTLYHTDKEQYHDELKQSMHEFLANRIKPSIDKRFGKKRLSQQ